MITTVLKRSIHQNFAHLYYLYLQLRLCSFQNHQKIQIIGAWKGKKLFIFIILTREFPLAINRNLLFRQLTGYIRQFTSRRVQLDLAVPMSVNSVIVERTARHCSTNGRSTSTRSVYDSATDYFSNFVFVVECELLTLSICCGRERRVWRYRASPIPSKMYGREVWVRFGLRRSENNRGWQRRDPVIEEINYSGMSRK